MPELAELIRQRDFNGLKEILCGFPAPDIAEIFVDLKPDDEAVLLRLLPRELAAEVFEYLPIEDQENALKALPELNAGLIITDFQMPDLNGFQFIRRAQRLVPGVPVLMITAVPEQFPEDEIHQLPALKAVVHKPFKWSELAVHIAKHWPSASQPPFPSAGA